MLNRELCRASVARLHIPAYTHVSALSKRHRKRGCIDVIKFSDKNRWRQGKIVVGFPEFLGLRCKLHLFNVSIM